MIHTFLCFSVRLDPCMVEPLDMRIGARDRGQGTALSILVSDTSFFSFLDRALTDLGGFILSKVGGYDKPSNGNGTAVEGSTAQGSQILGR